MNNNITALTSGDYNGNKYNYLDNKSRKNQEVNINPCKTYFHCF